MPRVTELDQELASLNDLLNQPGVDRKVRQFIVRFSIPTSIKIIEECIARQEVPAHCLRRIVETYFGREDDSAQLVLTEFQQRVVDVLALEMGESRETVIGHLIQEFGPLKLSQVNNMKAVEQAQATAT